MNLREWFALFEEAPFAAAIKVDVEQFLPSFMALYSEFWALFGCLRLAKDTDLLVTKLGVLTTFTDGTRAFFIGDGAVNLIFLVVVG